MEGKAYAASVGRPEQSVYRELHAAKVAAVIDIDNGLTKHFSQLVEIHTAPAWLWPALVAAMLACRHRDRARRHDRSGTPAAVFKSLKSRDFGSKSKLRLCGGAENRPSAKVT